MVSIIVSTTRQHHINIVFANYKRQEWKEKELIIILNKEDMDIYEWKKEAKKHQNVTVFQLSEKLTLGECLNFGIEKSKFEYIAKFDDDDYYGPCYLKQSMTAFENTGASIVGKHTVFMYFENSKTLAVCNPKREKQFTRFIKGGTIMFKKEIFKKVKFIKAPVSTDLYFLRDCAKKGYKIFSTDRYNYTCIRRGDKNTHTQRSSDKSYLKQSIIVCKTDNFVPLVTKDIL
ncbi:glycosyltransferase [Alkalihalobacterium alkalinitrilicum]|uniref:glycosyltransferase n=1 Tax=Alkalihalobacterium alkalinitrilicum TaxID=427920 RepID=UPI000995D1FD|nr:glycosyltransferase family A protein [Alkalihalobacterium alkalinitrilicum]